MMNLEKEFEKFQKRKQFLQHACKYSRDVYTMAKSMTHEERINLQKEIQTMEEPKTDEKCIPALPNKEMFYFFFQKIRYKNGGFCQNIAGNFCKFSASGRLIDLKSIKIELTWKYAS